jgi:hypothetical protein
MAYFIEGTHFSFSLRRGQALCLLAAFFVAFQSGAAAQNTLDKGARETFETQVQRLRPLAPDELVARLRHRATSLLSRLPQFDPGSRTVDLMVEYPWATLRRRCPATAPMDAPAALALADGMLETGQVSEAAEADRGILAAIIADLDGRICPCKDKVSLALAAECAS